MSLSIAKRGDLLITIGIGACIFMGTYSHADDCNQVLIPTGVAPSYLDGAAAIQNLPANKQFDVLTQHNDIARTGAATHEDILTRSNVSGGTFGYLGAVSVEGKIYAQPLYVEKAAVECETANGRALRNTNTIYVATLENLLYAIDIDSQKICWSTPKLGCGQPAGGLLGMDPKGEGGIRVGIVSTPVIDLQKDVLYVVTRNYGGSPARTQFFVNTIDTRTGALVARLEVSSDRANGCNGNAFKPEAHNNRPGLLLVSDKLFLAFGSTIGEDAGSPYHGFVLGFDVSHPAYPIPMPHIFCSTPTTLGAGIWMSGGGLASDGSSIYLTTGNGAYALAGGDIADPDHQVPDKPKPGEYPNSFVKLGVADLAVQSTYTDTRTAAGFPGIPYVFGNVAANHTIFWARERSDADVGSGGLLLLGNRVIGGGKDGRLDVLDTNGFLSTQSFLAFFDADTDEGTDTSYAHSYNYSKQWFDGPNIHGGPVAWDVQARSTTPYIYVYAWSEKDSLKRFAFVPKTGLFLPEDARDASAADPTPSAHGSVMSGYKSMPGGMLSISGNGVSDGIVWAVVEEPYPQSRAWMGANVDRCFGRKPCAGCFLSKGKFAEYCDATQGYVAGRLYAFAADDNGFGLLPLLWGDKRSAAPNNFIPRYSKFTPPTIAHGKVVVATANDEVRFYGLGACPPPTCVPPLRRADSIISAWNDGGSSTFAIYPSAGSQFSTHALWKLRDGGWGNSVRWLSGDFDGDGFADVAAIWSDNGAATLTIRRSTGSTFMTPEQWTHGLPWDDSTQWLAGDFDGDGLTDIARVFNDSGSVSIDVYRSAGTYFEAPVRWATRDGGWDDSVKWASGDFDGDGLSDIAAIWNDGGTNTITVRKSTRSSFTTTQWITHDGGWLDSTKWLAGDFDGDGRSDIAAVWNDGGQATFAVYSSSGLQFTPHNVWAVRDGGWDDSIKWVSGDFDGDGLSDIAAIWNDGGTNTITVRKSTRSSFTTTQWITHDGGWLDSTSWLAGAFRCAPVPCQN